MVFGNLIAATQTSMKRMLAYSSISQAGYLLIPILVGNSDGYASMITYLVIYTFMNLGKINLELGYRFRCNYLTQQSHMRSEDTIL